MAGTTDDQPDDQPVDEGSPDDEPIDEGAPEGKPDEDGKPKVDQSKRISDLQSEKDKETARANKAEAALRTAKSADKGAGAGADDPESKALLQELREAGLDAVYANFPLLAEYGIERSLIEGSTRAEMRVSATSVVALIESVSTKVRNKVLAEHGIKAEPAGSTRKPPVNYESMRDEDFEKLLNSI